MNEEAKIYLPLNIREQALNVLHTRAEERRTRRLLAAIEVNQKKQAKLILLRDKDVEKFTKLMASAEKRLNTIRDMLDKVDEELRLAGSLSNNAKMLDEELGNG